MPSSHLQCNFSGLTTREALTHVRRLKHNEERSDADTHYRDAPADVRSLRMRTQQRLRRRRRGVIFTIGTAGASTASAIAATTAAAAVSAGAFCQSDDGQSIEHDHEATRQERDDA